MVAPCHSSKCTVPRYKAFSVSERALRGAVGFSFVRKSGNQEIRIHLGGGDDGDGDGDDGDGGGGEEEEEEATTCPAWR